MSKKPLPDTISTSELAALLGLTPQRIGQLDQAGVIQKTARGTYPMAAIASYCQFLRGSTQFSEGDGTPRNLREERTELVRVQRMLAELKLESERDRVVDVEYAIAAMAAELLIVKNRFLNLPATAAPRLALLKQPGEVEKYLRSSVVEILNELSSSDEIVTAVIKESKNGQD